MTDVTITRNVDSIDHDLLRALATHVRDTEEAGAIPGNAGPEHADYPRVYAARVDGDEFVGFATDLPDEREPWVAGYLAFDRDTVLGTDRRVLERVDGRLAATINAAIDAADAHQDAEPAPEAPL